MYFFSFFIILLKFNFIFSNIIKRFLFFNIIYLTNISYTINNVSKTAVSDANGSFEIVGESGAIIIVDYA